MKQTEIDKEVKSVLIEQNPYHSDFFVKTIKYSDGEECHCGGYNTLIEEIVAIYCSDLDRFDIETKEILMEDILKDINELKKKTKFIMNKLRQQNMKYSIKQFKQWNKDYCKVLE